MALKTRLQHGPGVGVAARHDARPEQGAFLAAGDAGADVENPAFTQLARAPRRVLVVRVAAVDEHVSRIEQRRQRLDHPVHGTARLDHEHHATWPCELRDELLRRPGSDNGPAGRAAREERIDLRRGPVVHRHGVPAARHVEHEVLAHDREPDDTDVGGGEVPGRAAPVRHDAPLTTTHSASCPVTAAMVSKSALSGSQRSSLHERQAFFMISRSARSSPSTVTSASISRCRAASCTTSDRALWTASLTDEVPRRLRACTSR